MEPPMNVARFLGSFTFLTLAEIGQSLCNTMSLNMLRFRPIMAQSVHRA